MLEWCVCSVKGLTLLSWASAECDTQGMLMVTEGLLYFNYFWGGNTQFYDGGHDILHFFMCSSLQVFFFLVEYSGQEIDRAVNVFEIQFDGY